MSTVDILTAARDKVAHGWVAKLNRDGDRVCAAQAIVDAWAEQEGIEGVSRTWAAYTTADAVGLMWARECFETAIAERADLYSGSVEGWNDTPGRTQEQVVDTFDHAIKVAERDL
jgi:hypothetical protein